MTTGILHDRVCVVTGAAGLLGQAICEGIVSAGGFAVVTDIDGSAALFVANELNTQRSGSALSLTMDITSENSIMDAISSINRSCGRIDGVVNSAYPRNANYGRDLHEVTYEDFCENVSMHLGGHFLCTRAFCTYFGNAGGGSIVNLASVYGVIAPRFDIYESTNFTMPVEYAATKSGVIQLTRYFAKRFGKAGVRTNSVSPGGLLDNQPDTFLAAYGTYCGTKGMLDPADVTPSIVYLLSDMARFVNGQNLTVDDGFSL